MRIGHSPPPFLLQLRAPALAGTAYGGFRIRSSSCVASHLMFFNHLTMQKAFLVCGPSKDRRQAALGPQVVVNCPLA